MTDHEPTPIERTQLIEIALSTYQPGSQNLTQINDLDHQIREIRVKMAHNADVIERLDTLDAHVQQLKHFRHTKSPEDEGSTLAAARTANLALRWIINRE